MPYFLKVNIQNLFMKNILPPEYFISSFNNISLFNFFLIFIQSIYKTNSSFYIIITNHFIILIIYLFEFKSIILWAIIFWYMILNTVLFTLDFNYQIIYFYVYFFKFVLFYELYDFFEIQKGFLANQPELNILFII